jgi:hypothetical protein
MMATGCTLGDGHRGEPGRRLPAELATLLGVVGFITAFAAKRARKRKALIQSSR